MAKYYWKPQLSDLGSSPTNLTFSQPSNTTWNTTNIVEDPTTEELVWWLRPSNVSNTTHIIVTIDSVGGSSIPTVDDVEMWCRFWGSPTNLFLIGRLTDPSSPITFQGYYGGLNRFNSRGEITRSIANALSFTLASDSELNQGYAVYQQRFRISGDQISLKIWLDSDPEPEEWDLQVSDISIETAGALGFLCTRRSGSQDANTNKIFEFGIGTLGDPAPTEESGDTGLGSSMQSSFTEVSNLSTVINFSSNLQYNTSCAVDIPNLYPYPSYDRQIVDVSAIGTTEFAPSIVGEGQDELRTSVLFVDDSGVFRTVLADEWSRLFDSAVYSNLAVSFSTTSSLLTSITNDATLLNSFDISANLILDSEFITELLLNVDLEADLSTSKPIASALTSFFNTQLQLTTKVTLGSELQVSVNTQPNLNTGIRLSSTPLINYTVQANLDAKLGVAVSLSTEFNVNSELSTNIPLELVSSTEFLVDAEIETSVELAAELNNTYNLSAILVTGENSLFSDVLLFEYVIDADLETSIIFDSTLASSYNVSSNILTKVTLAYEVLTLFDVDAKLSQAGVAFAALLESAATVDAELEGHITLAGQLTASFGLQADPRDSVALGSQLLSDFSILSDLVIPIGVDARLTTSFTVFSELTAGSSFSANLLNEFSIDADLKTVTHFDTILESEFILNPQLVVNHMIPKRITFQLLFSKGG